MYENNIQNLDDRNSQPLLCVYFRSEMVASLSKSRLCSKPKKFYEGQKGLSSVFDPIPVALPLSCCMWANTASAIIL